MLEYPAGNIIYRTPGFIDYVRISPRGDWVAFLDHPLQGDLAGSVAIVDRQGKRRTLSRNFNSARGLAWAGDDELRFSAASEGGAMALYSVSLAGKEHELQDLRGYVTLEDISRDGRALLASHTISRSMFFVPPGEAPQTDLYWHDASQVRDLSSDGGAILFAESGAGTSHDFEVFLRRTDGSPAKNLGIGLAMALSPDGKWAIDSPFGKTAQLFRLPTGAGVAAAAHQRFDSPRRRAMDSRRPELCLRRQRAGPVVPLLGAGDRGRPAAADHWGRHPIRPRG